MQKRTARGPQAQIVHRRDDWIRVYGAREHNLKNIDVAIPKGALTVITGPSGSGKSSLALDILFTEGKRRYVESLSSYARQFLGVDRKPEVDRIDGLCPAIAIDQKTVGANPRSTVGTITEIYDYLRVLYARVGIPHCPECKLPIKAESATSITKAILKNYKGQTITIAAPVVVAKKGEFTQLLTQLFQAGFYRFRIDGQSYKFKSVDEIKSVKLAKTYQHTIDLLIDTLEVESSEQNRVFEAIEKAFKYASDMCKVVAGTKEQLFSSARMCLQCSHALPELEPRFFSFNSPIGACAGCNGLGIIHEWPWAEGDPESWKAKYPDHFGRYADIKTCRDCNGQRLNARALSVTVGGKNIYEVCQLSIRDALTFLKIVTFSEGEQDIAGGITREVVGRLTFLNDVGLSYLSLNRTARTLSGGEGQRIRLATQIGSALSGVLYILDEPSIGLHQRDNDRLITTLKALRDQGNTVVVVEHDLDTMEQSDYLIDMGPAAGIHGGTVTAVGTPAELSENKHSLTGAFLSGKRQITMPKAVRKAISWFPISGADKNNLKNVDVSFPLGVLCGVSGVSGSGKSTLIMEELVPEITRQLTRKKPTHDKQEKSVIDGWLDKILPATKTSEEETTIKTPLQALVVIDQTPIGRTPRSNPATYLGVFDDIRRLFASLPESNARGYTVGRFSFNVPEGRCFECSGDGTITVSMQFLPDVVMVCKSCKGQRYNDQTLQIKYKDKNIAQVLEMTALEALAFFAAHRNIAKRLQLLCDVGLDYLKLGQPSTTLSGGEAQRIKLVDELAKRGSSTLYILDEPTTGLHSNDIERLLLCLNQLVNKGNSMVIIEHNIDVLKTMDYLIDMGPEGGDEGGMVIAKGTPREVAQNPASHTGKYLKKALANMSK
jgi:excinuclease ABC subunit A